MVLLGTKQRKEEMQLTRGVFSASIFCESK